MRVQTFVVFSFILLSLIALASSSGPSSPQKCLPKMRSLAGTAIECSSDGPDPLTMTSILSVLKRLKWNGEHSWQFAI